MFSTLPQELQAKIVSYIPKVQLQKLLGLPYIGDLCFRQFYDEVFIGKSGSWTVMEMTEDSGFLKLNSRATATIDQGDIVDIRFSSVVDFVAFTTDNAHRLDYKLVTFVDFDHYKQLKANAPGILQSLAHVCLKLRFTSKQISGDSFIPDSLEHFNSILVNPIHQLSISTSHYSTSGRPRLQVPLPLTSLGVMTSLSLFYFELSNVGSFFEPLHSLKFLLLNGVQVRDTELAHLPSGLESLTLIRSLILTGSDLSSLPASLKTLDLNTIDMTLLDRMQELHINIRHLHSLKSIEVSDLENLYDIQLPSHLKRLRLKGCIELDDITAVANLKSLESLTVSSGKTSSIVSFFVMSKLPDSIKKLVFLEFIKTAPHNLIDLEQLMPSLANPERPFVFRSVSQAADGFEDHDHNRISGHLMIDERFHLPKNLQHFDVQSPSLIISGIQLPPCLKSIKLSRIHIIFDFNKIVFPETTETIEVHMTKLEGLEGVQFPSRLKRLTLNECSLKSFNKTNISELNQLVSLRLVGNGLEDESFFSQLPASLESLALAYNDIKSVNLHKCAKLKVVNLTNCKLQNLSYDQLNLPDSVEELYLNYNPIVHVEPNFLFPSNLKILRFDDTRLALTQSNFFSRLPSSLTFLHISWGKDARDESAGYVLPEKLERLKVANGEFPMDRFFESLSGCQYLKFIDMRSIKFINIDFDILPVSLQTLLLVNIDIASFDGDVKHLQQLIRMECSSTDLLDVTFTLPPSLKYLDLTDCNIVQPEQCIDLSESSSLVEIALYDNEELDRTSLNKFLVNVKKRNPNFERIDSDFGSSDSN